MRPNYSILIRSITSQPKCDFLISIHYYTIHHLPEPSEKNKQVKP